MEPIVNNGTLTCPTGHELTSTPSPSSMKNDSIMKDTYTCKLKPDTKQLSVWESTKNYVLSFFADVPTVLPTANLVTPTDTQTVPETPNTEKTLPTACIGVKNCAW